MQFFSVKRLIQLIREDLIRKRWPITLVLLSAFIVSTIYFFMVSNGMKGAILEENGFQDRFVQLYKFHIYVFPWALVFTGIIYSSLAFLELSTKETKIFFLTLPATNFEKWLSKWLHTAILFPLVFVLLYQLFILWTYNYLAETGITLVWRSLTDPIVGWSVFYYIVLQSIFFLGAVSMPKYSFVKTVVVMVLVLLGLNYLYMFIYQWLVPELSLSDLGFPGLVHVNEALDEYELRFSNGLQELWENRTLFWPIHLFAMSCFPLLLLASYFKLTEKKV